MTGLSQQVHRDLAKRLRRALSERSPIDPLTSTHPALDLHDAYQIQLTNVRSRLQEGAIIRGHKIGLTSSAMQEMLGVDEPDFGHLLDEMFVEGKISLRDLISPRIEPEIAFVLEHDLRGPHCTPEKVLQATNHVVPALEIIDSRIRDWHLTLADTVADNASSAAVVLGTRKTQLDGVHLPNLRVRLMKNGELAESGRAAAVLGDPAKAVAWLVNRVGDYGEELRAGQVVLSGSCTRAIPVVTGDHITADIDVLGDVSISFS